MLRLKIEKMPRNKTKEDSSCVLSLARRYLLVMKIIFNGCGFDSNITIGIPRFRFQYQYHQMGSLDFGSNINTKESKHAISIPPRFQYLLDIAVSITVFYLVSIVLLIPGSSDHSSSNMRSSGRK